MKMRSLLVVLLLFSITKLLAQDARSINYHNPSWSPDGKHIIFESNRDGKFAVYTIGSDGSNLRKLTSGTANDEQPRWSKDGQKIVFISDRDGAFHIYLMDRDGSNQERITDGPHPDFIPDLSPKDDQVVFSSEGETYLIGIDRKGKARLPNGGEHLRWSHDGKRILFSNTEPISKDDMKKMPTMTRAERQAVLAKRDNTSEIYVMNNDGSGVRNLTNNSVKDESPEFSANGKRIYFISGRNGSPKIFVMNVDGSNVKAVVAANVAAGTSISPNEKFLVYAKQKEGRSGIYVYNIRAKTESLLIGQ